MYSASALQPLVDIRKSLDELISSETILIGHALENDLKTLRMLHFRNVDTAIVFRHPAGPPYRRALRDLYAPLLQTIFVGCRLIHLLQGQRTPRKGHSNGWSERRPLLRGRFRRNPRSHEMACNKQTASASYTDPKATTADPRFHFRDSHPEPKFHGHLQSSFYGYIYTSSNTSEHPDILNNVSEPGRTETSTNSG